MPGKFSSFPIVYDHYLVEKSFYDVQKMTSISSHAEIFLADGAPVEILFAPQWKNINTTQWGLISPFDWNWIWLSR